MKSDNVILLFMSPVTKEENTVSESQSLKDPLEPSNTGWRSYQDLCRTSTSSEPSHQRCPAEETPE